jgi:hypothetical protein
MAYLGFREELVTARDVPTAQIGMEARFFNPRDFNKQIEQAVQ